LSAEVQKKSRCSSSTSNTSINEKEETLILSR